MAFDVRCPACQAKLRFDDPPKRGEEIECGKCGQSFSAPSAVAFEETKKEKEKPADEPKKPKARKTVEAVPRTFFNHWILLLIVSGSMFVVITSLCVTWIVIAGAAKAEDMLACVPDNYNVIRGVNVKAMRNYPGAKKEQDKFLDADAVAVWKEAADKLGLNEDTALAYFIAAREAGRPGVLYLYGTTPSFKPADLGGGDPTPLSGGARAICPTRNLIAVVKGGGGDSVLNAVADNARRKPRDGTHVQVGNTGKLAVRGQLWTIFRNTGSLKGWIAAAAVPLAQDNGLSRLREGLGQAEVLATWTSFGSAGVKVGAGLELDDSATAAALVQDMKKGPLGKADESEVPNGLKGAMSSMDVKSNGAFYQYLEYKQQGRCAYLLSRVADLERAGNVLSQFVNPSRGNGSGAQ